ncbi:WbqC family protein [Agarivorans sp. Z349TD_8]|uniref:WbqC family protein n=1 Tax=Agarivorans sp. Z349TD_8 TaxID=3421434 RepID=UPI003D7D2B59
MKVISISQSNYIPWRGYFDIIARSDIFVIYDTAQYTKNDWRNRNKISTKQGSQWLTIPVKHKHLNQSIYSIEIHNDKWNKKHWKTLEQNYKNHPHFDEYHSRFKPIYQQDWKYLSELNYALILEINKCLNIKTKILNSNELQIPPNTDRNQKIVDMCKILEADIYLSGPAAKGYINNRLFAEKSIEVQWMDYSHYSNYPQVNKIDDENLSIIDLIFNVGPNSRDYI